MTGSLIGFLIEGFVALLLLVTIGYCTLLNRRLKRLRADEESLRATISELVHATSIAERAIQGFQATAKECGGDLSDKLERAEHYTRSLESQISEGEKVLARLARISGVARTHGLSDRHEPSKSAASAQRASGRAA